MQYMEWVSYNRNLPSQESEVIMSKTKVFLGLLSPEASLLGFQMAAFSLYPLMVSTTLCFDIFGVSEHSISSLYGRMS